MRHPKLKKVIISSVILGSVIFSGSIIYGQTYYVQPGDSLYSIAARYGTTISALQQSNGLTSSMLYPGQALAISSQGSVSKNATTTYTVKAGDSLFLIAQRYGISVNSLKSANNLSSDYLTVGKQLTIPKASTTSTSNYTTYSVKSGDSLFLIAQKYGITVADLKQANQLWSNTIWTGQTLKIPTSTVSAGSTTYYNYTLSSSDLDLLARLVSAESSGEPFAGQVAVAATILHRLTDSRYPNTIAGIVYQVDNGCYQYSPVLDGRINLAASASAVNAVKQALSGWDPSNGANGFYNPSKTTNKWVRSQTVTATIGDHVFFSY